MPSTMELESVTTCCWSFTMRFVSAFSFFSFLSACSIRRFSRTRRAVFVSDLNRASFRTSLSHNQHVLKKNTTLLISGTASRVAVCDALRTPSHTSALLASEVEWLNTIVNRLRWKQSEQKAPDRIRASVS